jgi:photosystem II stability/assembly factor-like uncharacterized protein
MTFYFGACAGGVWKTVDGGAYWENISDGYFSSAAIGAIAVSESDPNVIYVGTGESTIRGDVSYGDGVYKSTDGGKSWRHVGLADTHHIGQIRIHPQNPDLVYVAALGHAFGPNEERGIFRSRDGGKTWEQVLYRSDKAGGIDLSMDPNNPRILYAAIWEAYRTFWSLSSGGPDSSLYKSTDGGDTWTEITRNPGLPDGILGKIGVSVSPARPDRVWAIIEAKDEKAGLYRSDDGGATWEMLTGNRDLLARPWYYCHIFADPQDPETVYVNNLRMWKSTDGGRNFTEITTPHGDNHGLWIDPRDPQRMIEGNDGGACVSFNGGDTWSTIYNQFTGQFYHVATDNQFPYRVYGTQQDNSSISVPSASEKGAIPWCDCYPAGTGESGYIAVRPDDPNIVYVGAVGSSPGGGGALQRYDHRTKQIRLITVWPEMYSGWGAKDLKYRFAWTFPIVISPHDPNVLYATGNQVFRSTDEGTSWEAISPDLTRADVTKLEPSGGPLTLDTSGAEHYATVFAFAESPHEPGVLWAGSDDGLLHLSQDGGLSWQNITPSSLPEWSLISMIEPSPHDPGTVYVAATRYKLDDYRPYLFKTTDYGHSWQRISDNFPVGKFRTEITRAIREDPVRPGLLYVGTETGLYVSLDDGANWHRIQGNFPVAPVYDLVIKDDDLVVATHGRAFWILDDLTPLRQLSEAVNKPAYLFPPRPSVRRWLPWSVNMSKGPGRNYAMAFGALITFFEEKGPEGQTIRRLLDSGENPPQGVIVYYLLKDAPEGPVSLTFLDAEGQEIRTFTNKPAGEDNGEDAKDAGKPVAQNHVYAPVQVGLNRFVWDMRYPEAMKLPDDKTMENTITGPLAAPGTYHVRLTVGDESQTQRFEIRKDPRVEADQAALDAQFELGLQIRDKISETHQAISRLRRLREQVNEWATRARELGESSPKADVAGLLQAASDIVGKLTAIEAELIQTEAKTNGDRLRLPSRLNAKLGALISVVSSADDAPPKQAYDVFEHLSQQVDAQLDKLQHIIEEDIPQFNEQVRNVQIPPIV